MKTSWSLNYLMESEKMLVDFVLCGHNTQVQWTYKEKIPQLIWLTPNNDVDMREWKLAVFLLKFFCSISDMSHINLKLIKTNFSDLLQIVKYFNIITFVHISDIKQIRSG